MGHFGPSLVILGPARTILSDLKGKKRYAQKPTKNHGKPMFLDPRRLPRWLQNGILADFSSLWKHLGATCRQHGGQDGNLQATWPNLGRTGAVLGRSGAVLRGLGRFRDSKALSIGSGLADCATPVEDEVFEEEESAEVEGGPARPCHPACSRGRRIQALTRIPPGLQF